MNLLVAVVLVLLLWLPGALLHRGLGVARATWGTGRFAVEATLSLAFLSLVLLPVYLAGAPIWIASALVAGAMLVLAAVAYRTRREGVSVVSAWDGAPLLEVLAFLAVVMLLVPATLAHSGANVDDWWDLSFVSGWLAEGRVGFSQMALSADPGSGRSPVHPRFLWSVWLMLQAVVAFTSGEMAWRVQAGPLAVLTMVLVVSAQAALARALFRGLAPASILVTATLVMTAAWVWGTEALPLFVRGYQDKLFAAFVLAPVLLALVLDAARGDAATGDGQAGADSQASARRRSVLAVAAAAVATVSVHSLVFTMAVFVCAVAIAALHGRRLFSWMRANAGVVVALMVPALYPIGQALALASIFDDQGVSLATPDNPVVRAHLSLNRLIGSVGWAWVVHPGAVFGSVALAASVALLLAWRRRRREPAARVLIALTLAPSALMFVPGVAALAGRLWVPWMLYRLGWMVPVAPLLAYALVSLAVRARTRGAVTAVAFAVVVVVLSTSTAADRLRRGMDEHPGQPDGAPTGAAAVVYDYLAMQPGRATVLAPANFAELVPALSGKPVVAFPERGTLVFATDDERAYERLRDRAAFYSSTASQAVRDRVASRYGVRWAVLPRRQVASGSEASWMWRFGPDVLLAARAADESPMQPCGRIEQRAFPASAPDRLDSMPQAGDAPLHGACRNWWSATRISTTAYLSPSWTIVLETRDYFVVEFGGKGMPARSAQPADVAGTAARHEAGADAVHDGDEARDEDIGDVEPPRADDPPWLRPFALSRTAPRPEHAQVLASVTGLPGAVVSFALPPRFLAPTVSPIWTEGPGAWEDAPAQATVALDFAVACRVHAIEVVPHLPRERRDVLELRVGDRVVRAAATHNVGILVPVDSARARSKVTLEAASLLGNPVSLADVRVLGEQASCGPNWPVYRKPEFPGLVSDEASLVASVAGLPPGGRSLVALARHASRKRGKEAAVPLLAEATRRQPSLVEAWIDLGFAYDEVAAAATTPEQAATARASALAAFEGAVAADSNSAWARGCLAWAQQRAGHPISAGWNSLAAAGLDPMYADAWTVLAYVLGDLRLTAAAERALVRAERIDPIRNWPALARADLALARRDFDAAHEAMRAWTRGHPFDPAAREKIAEIDAAAAAAGQAAASPQESLPAGGGAGAGG